MKNAIIGTVLLFVMTVPTFAQQLPLANTEEIEVPGIGTVLVDAEQPRLGVLSHLTFTSVPSGKLVGSVTMGEFDPKAAATTSVARLRFKVLHVAGLPDPIILAIFDYGGGSDCLREPVPIAYVGGEFRSLLSHPVAFWTQEGFALGDLGKGPDPAFALFKEMPAPNAKHYGAHQFSVEEFSWDKATGKFRPSMHWRTKLPTDIRGAAAEVGIPANALIDFEKLLKWFRDFTC